MSNYLVQGLNLLRPDGDALPIGPSARAQRWLPIACLVAGGTIYGMVMGSFGGVWGHRLLQVLYSGHPGNCLDLAENTEHTGRRALSSQRTKCRCKQRLRALSLAATH